MSAAASAPRNRWEALGLTRPERLDAPADLDPLSLLCFAATCGGEGDPIAAMLDAIEHDLRILAKVLEKDFERYDAHVVATNLGRRVRAARFLLNVADGVTPRPAPTKEELEASE
jgi:hypothetical protein